MATKFTKSDTACKEKPYTYMSLFFTVVLLYKTALLTKAVMSIRCGDW